MKKRIFSIAMALIMAVAIMAPATMTEAYGSTSVSVRTSMPSFTSAAGKAYYYTDNNLFYRANLAPNLKYLSNYGGYCIGNCTWYTYARISEMLGYNMNSNFKWSASKWWELNKEGNYYTYGSTPKVGAIACYGTHVAVVEKVSNGKVYVSESGWKISSKKPTSASDLYFHYGTPWHSDLKGYIYVLDGEKSSAKNVDYSIKITSSKLNMRKGPGTTYDSVGYVKAGTYEVSQECGDWAKLSSNGYWVCLSFATKVSTAKETVVDTGTTTNYKVKVSVTNLNMRLGPGTSYKSKGYLDPGTYTVVKTSGTWGKLSETGYWISLNYATKVATSSSTNKTTTTTSTSTSSSSSLYKVKVTAIGLRMRTGPGTSYSSKGVAIKGTTYDIKDTKNGWGQLSKNGYWIKLSYTVPVNAEYNVKVTAKDLNMRTGPGILYAKKGYIKPGTYTITETSGGWGKLKTNGYWIKLSYVTKI